MGLTGPCRFGKSAGGTLEISRWRKPPDFRLIILIRPGRAVEKTI